MKLGVVNNNVSINNRKVQSGRPYSIVLCQGNYAVGRGSLILIKILLALYIFC